MKRDPAKKITACGIGIHKGEIRPVLVVNDRDRIVIASEGLNQEQAELLCDAYIDGLRGGDELPQDLLTAFLNNPTAIAALAPPSEMGLVTRELFKRGALGGMCLAAQGYWVETTPACTIH